MESDERSPPAPYAQKMEHLYALIYQVLRDDDKARAWLRTPNPMLGNRSPRDMVRLGLDEKLVRFVTQALEDIAGPRTDDDVEEAWLHEIDRRAAELDSGVIDTIPWEAVRARLRRSRG